MEKIEFYKLYVFITLMSKFFELTSAQYEPLYEEVDIHIYEKVGSNTCIRYSTCTKQIIPRDITVEKLEDAFHAKYIGFMKNKGHSFLRNED